MESIQLPDGVTSIGEYAFCGCKSLESIQLPEDLESIGEDAFRGCTSLESIQLPDGLKSIGEGTFLRCESLKSIQLPNSLTSIGKKAFYACSELVSIIVDSNNPVYDSRENCNAIIETSTDTLIAGCQNTVIPVGVTSIGDFAFSGCKSLESIQLPDGVKSIGESAFVGCTSLENITFGGTREQWAKIKKEKDWNWDVSAKVVHCTDGEIEI